MTHRDGPLDRQITGRCTLVRANDDGGNGDDDEGTGERVLTGVAVPFDTQTRIDNWFEGTFDEEFKRGAFKRSLGIRTPKLMFEHGRHMMIGTMPLGRFESLTETADGLEVEAPLFDNWMIEPIVQGLESEAINDMSIRFRPIKTTKIEAEARTDANKDNGVPLHIIEEAGLYELGPVMFPAYETGTSADVRSQLAELGLEDLDLSDQDVRLRLAMALLSADGTAGDGAGTNPRPGTSPTSEAGGPARQIGPTSGHPIGRPRSEISDTSAALERFLEMSEIERVM